MATGLAWVVDRLDDGTFHRLRKRAESAGRKAREKLGTLLVRAELITPQELEHGLDIQKRTLRRLGDILVELGYVRVDQVEDAGDFSVRGGIIDVFPATEERAARLERKLFGVCGGLGAHFGVDPTIVRVLFVISAIASFGLTMVAYVLMAVIVPDEPLSFPA